MVSYLRGPKEADEGQNRYFLNECFDDECSRYIYTAFQIIIQIVFKCHKN